MRNIVFITGYYGSGKTEFALNLAHQIKADFLIDLDIINPYFRSREFKEKLKHTEVISSDLEKDQYSDLPYLSKKIFLPFHNKDKTAIYDLGGNDLGAKVMRQFSKEDLREVDLYLIINIYRPETNDEASIIQLIRTLEAESRIKITGLINNTNLLKETTCEDVMKGSEIIKNVSQITRIPIVYTAIDESLDIDDRGFAGEVFRIKRFFGKKWRS